MRKLVGFGAVAVAVVAGPAASAGPILQTEQIWTARIDSASSTAGDTATGGCFFVSQKPYAILTPYEGLLGDFSFTRDPNGHPTNATVSCRVEVNGGIVATASFTNSLTGAALSAAEASTGIETGAPVDIFVPATDSDIVSLCEDVQFEDGSSSGWFCQSATEITAPAGAIPQVLDDVFGGIVDPAVCPTLRSLAGSHTVPVGPFAPGVLIKPDGDVVIIVLDQNPVYDCPPY
jgi:hypothetical protein